MARKTYKKKSTARNACKKGGRIYEVKGGWRVSGKGRKRKRKR